MMFNEFMVELKEQDAKKEDYKAHGLSVEVVSRGEERHDCLCFSGELIQEEREGDARDGRGVSGGVKY